MTGEPRPGPPHLTELHSPTDPTPSEARIGELVTRWEQMWEQGQTIPAEELCRDCPELVEAVRGRILALQPLPLPKEPAAVPTPETALPRVADYEILGELGRGGMGVVYRARDRRLDRPVALKTMHGSTSAALYRFKQEFRALANVTHPNLVTLYELVAEGEQWFFTMELVEGVDFQTYLQGLSTAYRSKWERQLRAVIRQVAEGVQALHRAGKLHRDLKPRNVLVTPSGRVVILDFGLAAELDRQGLHQSTELHLLGTVEYMSPEQAGCLPLSPASDWYSVGVMLYEALAGCLPFSGSPLQVLRDKADRDPVSPRARSTAVPADLDALCMALLCRDPRKRLSGSDLLAQTGGTPRAPSEASPPEGPYRDEIPFIGRERHLDALRDAFAAVQQGRTVVTYVAGRSGVGKSTLVRRFLDGLRQEGRALVLAGQCYEQESVPYKAFDGLVDALSRHLRRMPNLEAQAVLPRDFLPLVRVFPVLRHLGFIGAPLRALELPDPQEMRRRAFAALRELLGRLGDRTPLVLCIDDLQWADVDSAPLLAELLRPPDPPVFLLIACHRSEKVAGSWSPQSLLRPWDQFGATVEFRELAVEALTRAEARELASRLLGLRGQAEGNSGDVIARESGGNPFFVQELVEHHRPGTRPAPSTELTLEAVLWDRVLRLEPAARLLVEVVAVAGRPLRTRAACRAAGVGASGQGALATLGAGRLVRGTGPAEQDEIEVYHDRVRETVLARLAPDALRDRHGRLARALEEACLADPEVLAIHWLGADEPERAAGYYARAADRAGETLAFDRAAQLYRLALDLGAASGKGAHDLSTRLADALANAGRGEDAARAYLAVAAASEAPECTELQRRAAMQFLISGHVDEGTATLQAVLSQLGLTFPRTPRRALWGLLFRSLQLRVRGHGFRLRDASEIPQEDLRRLDAYWAAAMGLSMIDTIRGAYFQARGLLLALRAGEPVRIARALSLEAMHQALPGERNGRRVAQLLQTAETVAAPTDNPEATALVALARGMVAFLWGRWQAAHDYCFEAEQLCRNRGVGLSWELDTSQIFALANLLYMGEIATMARRLPALIREAQDRGSLYLDAQLRSYVLVLVRLGAGCPAEAERELHEEMQRWSRRGYHIPHHLALMAQVTIHLYRGNGQAAWDHLTREWGALERSLLLRIQRSRIDLLQLRARSALAAAVAAPDPKPFVRAAERDAHRLESEKAPWGMALARLIRAGLASHRGDGALAAGLLATAAADLDAVDMRINAAACRCQLGKLLGGDAGRALSDQATSWMTAQGIQDPARMTAVYAPGFAV